MNRFIFLLLCSLIQFFLFVKTSAADIPGWLETRTGLNLNYSDNALYIFNAANNTLTTGSDLVFEPYLTLKLKKNDPIYSQKLTLYVSSDIYSKYSPLNFQTYSLLLEQGIGKNTFLNFKYTLIPSLVIREEDISVTGQNGIDTNLNYSLQIFTMALDKDFNQDYNFYFYGKSVIRDYSASIAYRSAIDQTLGGDLTFRINKQTIALAGLFYEVNRSQKGFRSIGMPPTALTFNDNTDYTSPGIALSVTRHVSPKDYFRIKYRYQTRQFSADSTDLLHGGREDQLQDFIVNNYFKIITQWTWKVGYELFKIDSNRSYANYTENILSAGIEYLF
ncbi:MAG: hypothetical protein ACYDBV_10665 [Nitrospiria bacterium]